MGAGALVTGGGTGIGSACATELARLGAKVMICGRTRSKLEDTVAALREEGLEAECVTADVTDETQVVAAVNSTVEWAGKLRGVVANAGGGGMLAPYHLQDAAEYRRVLEVNVVGTMLCVKHSVPAMVAAGGGSFVAISSIASTRTHPVFGAYPVAKAAIDAMMRNTGGRVWAGRPPLQFGPAGFCGDRDHGGGSTGQPGLRELPAQHTAWGRVGTRRDSVRRRLFARRRLVPNHRPVHRGGRRPQPPCGAGLPSVHRAEPRTTPGPRRGGLRAYSHPPLAIP